LHIWINFCNFVADLGVSNENLAKFAPTQKANPVVANFATTAADGKVYQVEYYSLDVILSVGYRVKSSRGIEFRRWSNHILNEHILRGYTVNQRLLAVEERMDRKFSAIESELREQKEKIDFLTVQNTRPIHDVKPDDSKF